MGTRGRGFPHFLRSKLSETGPTNRFSTCNLNRHASPNDLCTSGETRHWGPRRARREGSGDHPPLTRANSDGWGRRTFLLNVSTVKQAQLRDVWRENFLLLFHVAFVQHSVGEHWAMKKENGRHAHGYCDGPGSNILSKSDPKNTKMAVGTLEALKQ